ncbi:MAG: Xaa-Pro peptidase family protein [Terriglobia bacterium]|nr:Xaa-Pro peptidase family protein [Terriglobia bacterium]
MKQIRSAAIAWLIAIISIPAFAQYTDKQAFDDLGGGKEFARRRGELAREMKSGTALLFARINDPEGTHYREDNDFYYYTGIADEGAVLLIDGASGRSVLFEPQQPPRIAQVYGPNVLALPKDQQTQFGFAAVLPLNNLSSVLASMASRPDPEFWVRLGFPDKVDGARQEVGANYAANYDHPFGEGMPRDREIVVKLRERFPQSQLKDLTPLVDGMRNIKTPQEIEIMRRNAKISAEGNRRAIARAKPGMYEYEIEAEAYYWYYKNGAQGVAYPAIVGSGPNVNTWHYFQNRRKIEPNDLVVFDYAADLDHLTMDITRTFNISGKFTPEQAKWYAVDLEAQKAIINMLRPGNTYEQAAAEGKKVYEKYGIGDRWYNGFGHFVGEATHDVATPGTGPGLGGPIKAGQVVTVEPIVEFPEKHIHIRIEDTVLITDHGSEILSSGIPKEMADIERLVGSEAK